MTAVATILQAAGDLDQSGHTEFSEWELTVASWNRDRRRFGMRGFEGTYPDHKRVSMELMGSKVTNPIKQGWLTRTKPNTYALTALGWLEIKRCGNGRSVTPLEVLYDAVAPLVAHAAFKTWLLDPARPKVFELVKDFLDGRTFAVVQSDVDAAYQFCLTTGLTQLPRSSRTNGTRHEPIQLAALSDLASFLGVLVGRFPQLRKVKKS